MGRRRKKPAKDATQLEIFRYEAGFSIDDLADQTRIPQRHILALETRELDKLPAPVFISGYLRNLAEFFEVDIDLFLSDYDFSREENIVPSLQQVPSFLDNQNSLIYGVYKKILGFLKSFSGSELLDGSRKRTIAIVTSTLILILFLIFFLFGKDHDLNPIELNTSIINKTESNISPSEKKTLNFGKINIHINEPSWIELNDGYGNRLFRDLASKGQNLEFFAPLPFEVLLGYAPGVDVTLNGEDFVIENIREDNSSRFLIQP